MTSKSKTKKVFIEITSEPKQENTSINHLLRRFKSHDVYPSSKKAKAKIVPTILKTSNDSSTITINLNGPSNTIRSTNSKKMFSNSKTKMVKSSKADWLKQNETKISSYINSGRKRNKIDTTKILNEESIQELETEENCKCYLYLLFLLYRQSN